MLDLDAIEARAEAVLAVRQEFKDAAAHMRYGVAETQAQRQRRYAAGATANAAWLEFCDNALADVPALVAELRAARKAVHMDAAVYAAYDAAYPDTTQGEGE
jgi:hypothetical protein